MATIIEKLEDLSVEEVMEQFQGPRVSGYRPSSTVHEFRQQAAKVTRSVRPLQYGVFVIINSIDQNAFVFRLARSGPGQSAPAAPTGFSVVR